MLTYSSWSGYNDELAWSAAWLYKATGESNYLSKAEGFYNEFGLNYFNEAGIGWDDKVNGILVLLCEATSDNEYCKRVNDYASYMMNDAPYTPKGLLYLDMWGSLRNSVNQVQALLQVKR